MEWFFYEIWEIITGIRGIITEIWKIVINDSVLISIFIIACISIVAICLRAISQWRPHSLILALAVSVFILFLAIFSGLFYYSLAPLIGKIYILVREQFHYVNLFDDTFKNVSLSIGGSITLSLALLGVILTVIRNLLTRQQNDTGEQKIVTEQISRAIDQIGAYKQDFGGKNNEPNIEARVGGIYSLERIAQNSDRDYAKVMNILCAYVRASALRWSGLPIQRENIREDIQAAIDVLGTKKSSWLFWKRDKFRVNLENCNLSGYRFSELNFNTYTNSSSGTIFDKSVFKNVKFYKTDLSYVSLDRATLTGADFEEAIFKDTRVAGVDLCKVKNLTAEQVSKMIGDERTKVPNGMVLSKIEESPN